MTRFGIVERPSYFGKKRDEIFITYDTVYGSGNWKIGHVIGENLRWADGALHGECFLLDFLPACGQYQQSYFAYFVQHMDEARWIAKNFKDIFDNDECNVNAGLDYTNQTRGIGTHIQDIAIRNVLKELGLEFEGEGLLQIRTGKGGSGEKWSPLNIPFHKPEWIMRPTLEGWWSKGAEDSVEKWYQSNKVLLVRK